MTTSNSKPVKRKVVAYITHGYELLVFRQPDFPEAAIQVPTGSVEPGEPDAVAALREAFEETGLAGLELVTALGQHLYDMTPFGKDELQARSFFHLRCTQTPPETWVHYEEHPSTGGPPIAFAFFWATLPDAVRLLTAGQGDFSRHCGLRYTANEAKTQRGQAHDSA